MKIKFDFSFWENELVQYSGFAMVGLEVLFIILLYILKPVELTLAQPFSSFLTVGNIDIVFVIGFLLADLLYVVYINLYLQHKLQFNPVLFNMSAVSLVVALLAPYGTSWGRTLHILSIGTFAILFWVGTLTVAYKTQISFIKKTTYLASIIAAGLILGLTWFLGNSVILLIEVTVWLYGMAWVSLTSFWCLKTTDTDK